MTDEVMSDDGGSKSLVCKNSILKMVRAVLSGCRGSYRGQVVEARGLPQLLRQEEIEVCQLQLGRMSSGQECFIEKTRSAETRNSSKKMKKWKIGMRF